MSELNRFRKQTAVTVITCNREDFLIKTLDSIDKNAVDKIFVVNAGAPLKSFIDSEIKVIQCNRNPTVVGIAKNIALREMKNAGYEFLFLMEDDVVIKNSLVFQQYIHTAMDSGLWAGQLSYGTHGGKKGGNVGEDGNPAPRLTVQYTHHCVDLYRHSLQAFVLYHANTLNHIGYMNESYINAAEHLDHYFHTYHKKLGCNFWYFPDIKDSSEYLEDLDTDHGSSVIRSSPDFNKNFSTSWGIFKEKYQVFPHEVPDSKVKDVQTRLNFIEQNYSQKNLLEKVADES